jgi:hypothetical protein
LAEGWLVFLFCEAVLIDGHDAAEAEVIAAGGDLAFSACAEDVA